MFVAIATHPNSERICARCMAWPSRLGQGRPLPVQELTKFELGINQKKAKGLAIDQDLSLQRAALKAAGATIIRAEKASGASRKGPQRA
jgi:hypothetical protein